MNDDKETKDNYLWDGTGEPDPEVQRLESALRQFRHDPALHPAPQWPASEVLAPSTPRNIRWRFLQWAPLVAAAALAILAFVVLRQPKTNSPISSDKNSWEVSNLAGAPVIGSARIGEKGRLGVGQWLETDSSSRANITVGDIGQVEVDPSSRIGLVEAKSTENRLALDRGTIHALISAPPRLFFVNTPAAVAVDLGCAYTLHVDDKGVGLLRVTFGWVEFETHGEQSLVPSGAAAITRPGVDPGTPFFEDAPASFKDALEKLDFETLTPPERATALHTVLSEARKRDGFTLLNLLRESKAMSGQERGEIYDRLAELIPPPPGVAREPMTRGNNAMVGLWWDRMGVGHPRKK